VAAALALIGPAPAPAATGDLSFGDCISRTGSGGECTVAPGSRLEFPSDLELSPGGSSLYAIGTVEDTISRFAVGPGGGLNFADCSSASNTGGDCSVIPSDAFDNPAAIEVSDDGGSVYATGFVSNSVVHLNADPAGRLTFAGCFSNAGSASCANVPGASFEAPTAMVTSPAGDSLYVAAFGSSSVSRFSLGPTGQLGFSACAANENSNGSCTDDLLPVFVSPDSLAVSPDGGSLYVNGTTGADSVTSLGAANLERADCVSDSGSLGGCENAPGDAFDAPRDLVVSPAGSSMYALSASGRVFHLSLGAGGQVSYAGCEAAADSGGICDDVPGAPFPQPSAAAISPDGTSLYVGSLGTQSVSHFAISPDGALTFRSCVSNDGGGGCADLPGDVLRSPFAIQVSENNRSVYVVGAASDSIVRLNREVPDTDPPGLTLTAKKAKAGKPVKVTASCDEACTVELRGTAKPKGSKRGKLGAKAAELGAGASATLALKPKGKLKRRLKDAGKGKAMVSATATDAAGNEADASRKVKLK
jgi:DNA-binding beta-propeller fold protein YncE